MASGPSRSGVTSAVRSTFGLGEVITRVAVPGPRTSGLRLRGTGADAVQKARASTLPTEERRAGSDAPYSAPSVPSTKRRSSRLITVARFSSCTMLAARSDFACWSLRIFSSIVPRASNR